MTDSQAGSGSDLSECLVGEYMMLKGVVYLKLFSGILCDAGTDGLHV